MFDVSVDGTRYRGKITHHLEDIPGGFRRGYNMRLETESPLVSEPVTSLGEVLDAGRRFTIQRHFLPVDVRKCFHEYGYIGSKAQCRAYIEEKLKAADH